MLGLIKKVLGNFLVAFSIKNLGTAGYFSLNMVFLIAF